MSRQLKIEAVFDGKQATAALNKLEGHGKSLGGGLTSSFKNVNFELIAIGAAAAAVGVGIKAVSYAFNEWKGQEQAVIGLNAALKITGQYSDATSDAFKKQASAIQAVTTLGDDYIIGLQEQAILLGTNADAVDDVTKAALGLTKVYGTETSTVLKQIDKLLSGQTNSLSRLGIQVDKNATYQERLNAVVEAGAEGYQALQADTKTIDGALAQLKNSVGDTSELLFAMSGITMDDLVPALNALNAGIAFVNGTLEIDLVNAANAGASGMGVMIDATGSLTNAAYSTIPVLVKLASVMAGVYAFTTSRSTSKRKGSLIGMGVGGPLGALIGGYAAGETSPITDYNNASQAVLDSYYMRGTTGPMPAGASRSGGYAPSGGGGGASSRKKEAKEYRMEEAAITALLQRQDVKLWEIELKEKQRFVALQEIHYVDEDIIKSLKDQLDAETDIYKYVSGPILEAEEKRLELQKQILDKMEKQEDALDAQEKKNADRIATAKELLNMFRPGDVSEDASALIKMFDDAGQTLDKGLQEALINYEKEWESKGRDVALADVVNAAKALGISPDNINNALSLPVNRNTQAIMDNTIALLSFRQAGLGAAAAPAAGGWFSSSGGFTGLAGRYGTANGGGDCGPGG
jgi:hypothetical protein